MPVLLMRFSSFGIIRPFLENTLTFTFLLSESVLGKEKGFEQMASMSDSDGTPLEIPSVNY